MPAHVDTDPDDQEIREPRLQWLGSSPVDPEGVDVAERRSTTSCGPALDLLYRRSIDASEIVCSLIACQLMGPAAGMSATPSFAGDYSEIANLLARYCILLDLDDFEAWVALFTPDGMYDVYWHTFRGHDALRTMMVHAPGDSTSGARHGRVDPR